jgi:molybdopterin synthase catalytic subunit/molybdopterin converting factor small subunit
MEPLPKGLRLLHLPSVQTPAMRVKVLFFGSLRDLAGRSEDSLNLAALPHPVSLASVFEYYAGQFPKLSELRSSIVMARNQQFSSPDTLIYANDEIALLPPVSGGSGHFLLTRDPIDAAALARQVAATSDGAVVTFEGIVRDNTKGRRTLYLEYEGYEAMAVQVMEKLGAEITVAHAIGRIAMVHRLGRMEVGEASVVIVASAPHRRPAFEAALEAIDRLKRTVPIWKKEYFEDGAVWVDGEWDADLRAQTL